MAIAAGEVGQAFSLNGTNADVRVPASASLNVGLAEGFTIECWIKPTDVTSGHPLVEWNNGSTFATHFWIFGNPKSIYISIQDTSGTSHNLNGPANILNTTNFQHVAATYDKASGVATLYRNGAVVATTTLGSFTPQTSYDLFLGRRPAGVTTAYYQGLMDEVSLYRRALSASEISAIYNASSAGKCVPPPNCTPPPSGLVSWWPGEGYANDIAGNNNGTLQGSMSFVAGEVGQAFDFDGTSGYVNIPASASLDVAAGGGLTVECWINPASSAANQALVEWNTGLGKLGVHLWISQDPPFGGGPGSIYVNLVDTTGAFHTLTTAGDILNTNGFQHVALTYDKASGATCLYYNGGLASSQPLGSFTPQTSLALYLGERPGDASHLYRGVMDEVSLYNRALGAAEIQAIYTAGSAGKCRLPRAATASAVELNGFVVGATITDAGFGYTNTPPVRIIGGGGSGAQAVAVVSNGVVVAVNVLAAGSGYTNAPVIVIEPPFIAQPTMDIKTMSLLSFTNLALGTNYQFQVLLGNTWSNLGAAFTAAGPFFAQYVSGTADPNRYHLATTPVPLQARATPQLVNGFVVGAIVTSGGSGYVTNPAVIIVGGGGTNATAVSHVSGGRVTSITITDAGIGYTSTPTIQIAPPPLGPTLSPTVQPVMRLDSASLSPYDNYQIQFKPDISEAWGNWNGGLFSPTGMTLSQYLFITNGTGFFRLQYVP